MSRSVRDGPEPLTVGLWCATCCTAHPVEARCPGELRATGPEEEGWKVTAKTPRGLQGYGVLLAPSHELWRARIVTFPRTLWLAPGLAHTAKFVGRTREEAERKARDFVRAHCIERGYLMRDELVPVISSSDGKGARQDGPLEPRFHRTLPVRFGEGRPTVRGTTANLSATGLFVVTDWPLPPARQAALVLELEHCAVPLRGRVVWSRTVAAAGRPAGMGMALYDAPRAYRRYVQALE